MTFAAHNFFSLLFQQTRNIIVSHVNMAEELKTSCASVGAGNRAYPKSKVLWLVLAMGALSMMLP